MRRRIASLNSRSLTFCLLSSLCCASVLIWPLNAKAAQYTARGQVGGYFSSEDFTSTSDGTSRNDFATVSARFFTKVNGITGSNLELVCDVRDKHDFFDKFDRQKLELTGKNSFQVPQLSLKYPNAGKKFFSTVGRFPVVDAGAASVDGADIGLRWSSKFRTNLFGGMDPKRADQTYYQTNKDSNVYGGYLVFQPISDNWKSTFFFSSAFVTKTVSSHIDRQYNYSFFLYQWENLSRILASIYLDFKPRTYMQNGFISYNQKISKNWQATADAYSIDVIEYTRRRGILETLPSSPYHEESFTLRQNLSSASSIDYVYRSGKRKVDGKTLSSIEVAPFFDRFFDKRISAGFRGGYKKNFVSDDSFLKASLGYYSKDFELNLDETFSIEKNNDGNTYHPIINELSSAIFLSREVYSSLSLQYVTSERVKIYSASLYLGFRMGSKDVPPLRDGAPPRGRL